MAEARRHLVSAAHQRATDGGVQRRPRHARPAWVRWNAAAAGVCGGGARGQRKEEEHGLAALTRVSLDQGPIWFRAINRIINFAEDTPRCAVSLPIMRAALFVFGCIAAANAAEVVVFGDSWGTEGKKAFQDMFDKRGVKVSINNVAVGGTTAAGWAKQPDALKQAMDKDTKHVWVTIGGNDAQADLPGCGAKCIPKCINETLANTKAFQINGLGAFNS